MRENVPFWAMVNYRGWWSLPMQCLGTSIHAWKWQRNMGAHSGKSMGQVIWMLWKNRSRTHSRGIEKLDWGSHLSCMDWLSQGWIMGNCKFLLFANLIRFKMGIKKILSWLVDHKMRINWNKQKLKRLDWCLDMHTLSLVVHYIKTQNWSFSEIPLLLVLLFIWISFSGESKNGRGNGPILTMYGLQISSRSSIIVLMLMMGLFILKLMISGNTLQICKSAILKMDISTLH